MRSITFIFLCLFSYSLFASETDSLVCHVSDIGGHCREHNVDFDTLRLDVRFLPKTGEVFGKELLSFKPIQPVVDSVYLDAPGIVFNSILFSDPKTNITFKTTKDGVAIYFSRSLNWNKNYKLTVDYKAKPRKGLYFIGWNDEKNLSRKQIWTQGQGIDNRHWFPCYDDVDDKVVTETNVTFDKNYTVVSNGNLIQTKINADSTKTWQYRITKPHSPYLVMIAIEKYGYKDIVSKNGIVSRQYFYADRPQDYEPTYKYSKEMMDWLANELQVPYPWKTYSNSPVQDFMFGAMENTTATVYGDFYLHDARANIERGYVATNAHELTHQWFGDYITEWSATHHWLHESFATYYSKLFCASVFGQDSYEWTKYNESQSAINADKNDRFPVAHSRGGSSRHYPKGSFVIDMLRYVVGDSVYRKCVTKYLEKHAYGLVDTHDFYRTFMENAGINLDWFFDEWIYKSGVPELSVSYWKENDVLKLTIEQMQLKDSLIGNFRMPFEVAVYDKEGHKQQQKFLLHNANDTFLFPLRPNTDINFVLIDPGCHILKTLRFERKQKELLAQARWAENMIDRYLALVELRDTPLVRKEADLLKLFATEKSLYPRLEIISQLGKSRSQEVKTLFVQALADTNFLVRRAVVESIDSIDKPSFNAYEKLLSDTSYITVEMVLKKLIKQYPDRSLAYFDMTKSLHGISENVRITWLELQITEAKGSLYDELVDYTSHSYEFRTRVKAMDALQRLGFSNERLVNNLLDAYLNPNSRLAGPAERAITQFVKKDDFKKQVLAFIQNRTWEDWQKERLDKWR